MSIEAMKQALEALKWASDQTEPEQNDHCLCPICKGIDALSQAIAETEKQEPVAWRRPFEGDVSDLCQWLYADEYEPKDDSPNWQALYTHPQPAQPKAEGEHALERALTRLQKRYSELEAKVAAQPKAEQAWVECYGENSHIFVSFKKQDPDYKALWEQMCERCDWLDKELAAYTEQEQGEPMGTLAVFDDAESELGWSYDISATFEQHKKLSKLNGAKLYTTQQQRKPLTDETRNWIVATCPTPRHIIDAVERMHGIKE
jgi:hypothetical protein